MQNSNIPSCNIEQQESTRKYETYIKDDYEYYIQFFPILQIFNKRICVDLKSINTLLMKLANKNI